MKSVREILKTCAKPMTDGPPRSSSGNKGKGLMAEVMNWWSKQNGWAIKWFRKAFRSSKLFCNKQLSLCLCCEDIKKHETREAVRATTKFCH